MAKKLVWHTEQRRVCDLLPFKANPRKISEKEISDLKKSLKKFNLVEIPAITPDNKIIAGHQRCAVLQLLGRGEELIDCRVPSRPLTKTEYKQYLITSNKVHGTWDNAILTDNFEMDLLLVSGFSDSELEDIYESVLDTEDKGFSIEKELAKIKDPVSTLGSLYQLGPHRLLCASATDLEAIKRLVGDEKMDMAYCDPIYNIDLSYQSGIGGTRNYGGSTQDKMSDEKYEVFLQATMENALAVSKDDVHMFYYSDQKYVALIQKLYEKIGIKFQRTCIWLKGVANPTPQVAFSKVYEPITYGVRGKPYLSPQHKNFDEVLNKETGTGHQLIDSFLDMFDVWAVKKLSGQDYSHPTQKPITLHDKPIRRCTRIGDNILSLFGGSGGELIAADQLKRKCFMVELDPIFVDLIIRHYEFYTGNKAKKIN
ncbi:MAG: methylase protein [Parcubacteria group bacterium GW2011_GWC1_39_29]|nr:MAG: methylase protein [Parcubacteria group bacterium GW2011_GWC1_39_29]